MFGFQSTSILPDTELKNVPGSNQINELQWVLQPFIGDAATKKVAELHLPSSHMPIEKLTVAVHALHIANIVHFHHQS